MMFKLLFHKEYIFVFFQFIALVLLSAFIQDITEVFVSKLIGFRFFFNPENSPFLHLIHVLLGFISLVSIYQYVRTSEKSVKQKKQRIGTYFLFLTIGFLTGLVIFILITVSHMNRFVSLIYLEVSFLYHLPTYGLVLGFVIGSFQLKTSRQP